jgi:transcriptional regulator with XRE-family HTH domain
MSGILTEDSMQGMIRRLRKKRGFSQAQLAEKIGKSRSTVAMWELGTNGVTVSVLYALAKALDVPITSFFEDDPQEERPTHV